MSYFTKQAHRAVIVSFIAAILTVPAFAATEQTPWKTTVGNGTSQTNLNWPGYNTGYDFTPQKNGVITKLGGFFNGVKTVRLYNSAGVQLAVANASDNNNWGYMDITPVTVNQGQRYTIAVETGWGGASMYIGQPGFGFGPSFPVFPHTVGDIRIERAVFGFGSNRPSWEIWGQMWGQADVVFVANQ